MADWRTEFQYLLDRKILSRDELGYLFGQIKSIIEAKNKRMREAIEAALRISDLWTLGEVETMFEDEAKTLLAMKEQFEQALKGEK